MSQTTMKTAIAISATTRNILSVSKIPPATVTTSQMARIALRIVPMIRPMYLVCAPLRWQATGLEGQPHEHQPVAQRLRRVVVRFHLGEAEAPVQRQRLALADAGVEIHGRVCLITGGAYQSGSQGPPGTSPPRTRSSVSGIRFGNC